MDKLRSKTRSVPAAQRGHIIQCVLVDGWTVRQAAEALGVAERRVNAWIADYRRHGMASLRDEEAYIERLHRRIWRRCYATLQRHWAVFVMRPQQRSAASFVVLKRTDDGRSRL